MRVKLKRNYKQIIRSNVKGTETTAERSRAKAP